MPDAATTPAEPEGPPPLCFTSTQSATASSSSSAASSTADAGPQMIVRSLRPERWWSLLVQGYEQGTGTISGPLTDCTGHRIEVPAQPEDCLEHGTESELLPRRAVTEDDLVILRTTGGMRLVWAIVDRYSNGEGIGPVALAEFTRRGVAIRAIGTLRAQTRRPRLRIENLEPDRVLVADGEHCLDDSDPTSCRRTIRMLPIVNNRFESSQLTLPDGECVGEASFPLLRVETSNLGNGWERRFELTSNVAFNNSGISVHEQMIVADTDPSTPSLPRRLFRRVDTDRTVQIVNGRLVTNAVSLWTRVLESRASVRGGNGSR